MASLIFKNVYINDQETVVGPYENNGILIIQLKIFMVMKKVLKIVK